MLSQFEGMTTYGVIREIEDCLDALLEKEQERENPTPLTLEQLKQMEDKSDNIIWIKRLIGSCSGWFGDFRFEGNEFIGFWVGNEVDIEFELDDYGVDWLPYAYKPKAD